MGGVDKEPQVALRVCVVVKGKVESSGRSPELF